jgi:hydrogenase maturation factor HypE
MHAHREPAMTENLFSAVLTFSLLAGGTIAVGSEMLAPQRVAAAPAAVATLPPVTVVGKRIAATDAVLLPTVVITGCRQARTEVAIDDTATGSRLQ